jgi:hypothetical protein
MEQLSALAFKAYRGLVYETDGFADYFWGSTVITEIATLNIGSRPASRKKTREIEDLRAIPWVFSWAQCRLMLPGWYGFGSAVESWVAQHPDKGMPFLKELYREWPFFRTLLSNMDMVLAKSSIAIASRYAELVPDAVLRAVGERRDAVEEQSRRSAPHRDVGMFQPKPLRLVAALQPAEHEDRRQAQRHRDDRRTEIVLVPVLMQGHPRAGLVAIDQAGVRRKAIEAALARRPQRQLAKRRRHRRPGFPGIGVDAIVAIAAAIGDPAGVAAIGHRHRHLMAAGREHMPERRLNDDLAQRREQITLDRPCKSAQQHGAIRHRFPRRAHIRNTVE